MCFSNNIKTLGKFDIVIIGAGPGGSAAAIAASRLGKSVLLLEKTSGAGGVGINTGCSYLMGYGLEGRQIVGGIAEEFARTLEENGQAVFDDGSTLYGKPLVSNISTSPHGIRRGLNVMFKKYNVNCLFYSAMIAVNTEGERIKSIFADTVEGICMIEGKSFVDATGDAHLVYRAGGETITHPPEECMTKTLFFSVAGVKPFNMKEMRERYHTLYVQGKTPIPHQDRFMAYILPNKGTLGINMTMTEADGLSSLSLTKTDFKLREQIDLSFLWLKENIEEFKDSYLIDTSFYIGVRCGRSILGESVLTRQLIENEPCGKEPIALGMRSFGGHGLKGFKPDWASDKNGMIGIPWKTLISKSFCNVFAAGRCISAESKIIDTFRFMPRCMAIGEAAGVTAALANGSIENTGYEEVKRVLLENGAILA